MRAHASHRVSSWAPRPPPLGTFHPDTVHAVRYVCRLFQFGHDVSELRGRCFLARAGEGSGLVDGFHMAFLERAGTGNAASVIHGCADSQLLFPRGTDDRRPCFPPAAGLAPATRTRITTRSPGRRVKTRADEVHTYDPYPSVLLKEHLSWRSNRDLRHPLLRIPGGEPACATRQASSGVVDAKPQYPDTTPS